MKPFILLILALVYGLANFYVFFRIGQALPSSAPAARILWGVVAVVLASSFFIAFLWAGSMPVGWASLCYKTGTSWMFILLYLFLFLLLRDVLLGVDKFFPFLPAGLSGTPKFTSLSLWVATGLASILLLAGYLHYTVKKRVELSIHTSKAASDSKPLKIVAVSDLHLGYGIGNSELKKWVDAINAENPDLILIAGDVIDTNVAPLEENHTEEYLRQLRAPLGVYACVGNHEYISNLKRSSEWIERSGIHLLRDSVAEIGHGVSIVGRDDRSNPRRKPLSHLTANLDPSRRIILLDHQPYHLEEAVQNGVDLQLSGHTHRGQVWPINWITDKLYEVSHGYKQKGNTHIYVSSGIGIWGGKFRIGSQSEYVVIHFQ